MGTSLTSLARKYFSMMTPFSRRKASSIITVITLCQLKTTNQGNFDRATYSICNRDQDPSAFLVVYTT